VPADEVIQAPRVYTKAVAVKTLVVELLHSTISPGIEGRGGAWLYGSFRFV